MTPASQFDASFELSQVLDLVHLSRQTFGDPDLERDVLGLFRVQIASTKQSLKTCPTVDERRRLFHLLKGSARGVGAVELAQLAQVAEDAPSDELSFNNTLTAIDRAGEAVEVLLAKG